MKMTVAKTMAAFIGIQRSAGRHTAWVPDGVTVLYVVILSVGIYRNVIVAVAGDAKELGILIEAVAAAGIGNQGEEILRTKVVDPGKRCVRGSNDVFFPFIVKMSEIHGGPP